MQRSVDIGQVISRATSAYGAQAGVVLPAALIVFGPVALLDALLGGERSGGSSALAFAVSLLAGAWFQAMVVEAVRDIQDGRRDLTLAELLRAPTPVLGPLVITGLLAFAGIAIGMVLFIVPGLLLLTWWAVIVPVVVVERPGIGPAFSRSRELVRGHAWQVFALLVVMLLILGVLTLFVAIGVAIADSRVATALGSLVSEVLLVPFVSITVATLYFALREAHGEAPVPALAERSYGPGGGFAPPQSPTPERPDIGLS